ncbi:NUC189-domain-containing protein [Nadsonia fulvescens var. elongata DSM 6958]|uniref:NUC189-domain-containing protein n=1 Tax=Nadsonia fulvescens var. elongata DSM 6958 TaxID=857566 RepID=A0A1E3PDK7_9ASCO|nr:NUC189-domain-containing protein [Nadsonia fulvescens var. elongata DSM 6958]
MTSTTPTAVDLAAAGANASNLSAALTQALKTNDDSTLQSLLTKATDDQAIIKTTVQRLESTTAVKLLEKLAEQITATPSKSNQLNLWIKWVMVAHGGYLVSLPHLIKTLTSLHSVLNSRVTILPKLIALQGRLEMLQSQLELRDNIAKQAGSDDEDSDSDEENSDEDNSDIDDEVTESKQSGNTSRQLTIEADADDLEAEEGDYIINGEEDDDLDSEDEDEENDNDNDEDDDEEDNIISRFIDVEASDDEDNDDDDEDDVEEERDDN